MPRMTSQLLKEIIDVIDSDIETLEIEMTTIQGDDVPNDQERAAIDRVQGALRTAATAIRTEVDRLATP